MAAGGLIKVLCEEATCSICLEYFKEPVTAECGHNFCQACITQCWGESRDTVPSCPQCREPVQQKTFKPNKQLARIVEQVRFLEERKRAEGKQSKCQLHQEPLKLFCRDDQALICLICERSKEHRDHSVVPAEEAAQEYKEIIQDHMKCLEKARENLVDQKLTQELAFQEYLSQSEVEKHIMSLFEQIRKVVEEKERFQLEQLGALEKELKEKQKENLTRLSEKISCLSDLIVDIQEKHKQPADEFLQDIRRTLSRYEKKEDHAVELSPRLEERFKICCLKNSALEKAVGKYKETLEQALNKVNVTLDPDTANPWFVVDGDMKSLWRGERSQDLPDSPERFDTMACILGRERFTSGRHWWEVEMKGEIWTMGVARESIKRKGMFIPSLDEGIWAVMKLEDSSSSRLLALTSPEGTHLTLSHGPKKIRVSLDYEEGIVEFFDGDTDIMIFTFSSASFSGEGLRPFFLVSLGVTMSW